VSPPVVGSVVGLPVGSLPPGFQAVVRTAKARNYKVFVSPTGTVFPSARKAWAFYSLPLAGPAAPPVTAPELSAPVALHVPDVGPSESVLDLVAACGLSLSAIPVGIYTLSQVASSAACPALLRRAARATICDSPAVSRCSCRRTVVASPRIGARDSAASVGEVERLRAILPDGCERRMLGSDHAYEQATPQMRRFALQAKFTEASGPGGRTAARDRRFISRWLTFCRGHGIRTPWPIASVAFKCFITEATAASTGNKGGASVAHSLKLAAVHARDHFCLPVELDAAVLFNAVKPYKGDSDSATSPSLTCLALWEKLARAHSSPAVQHACQVATLACWLSLRAVHCTRLSVLDSSNDDDVRLNISKDKDGSSNVWVGCDARGLLGVFDWWPCLMARARVRGFLACSVSFDAKDLTLSSASLADSVATSPSMEKLFALAFAAAGVSRPQQLALRFSGHSPRHLLPCVAEVFMWHALLRDELGRWATGAANTKKSKCGPRYTVQANRSLQVFLRRSLRLLMVLVHPLLEAPDGHESAVPDFHAMSDLQAVRSSPMFGPHGPGFIPGFGRVSG